MKRHWVVIAMILVAGCGSSETRSLAWLDSEDAAERAQANIADSNYVFYVVCGFSCETPDVGWLEYRKCYAGFAGTETIDETGDNIVSDKHAELKSIAREFAGHHNRLMIKHLDAIGFNSCENGEDWGAAVDGIRDLVKSYGKTTFASGVGLALEGEGELGLVIDFDQLSISSEMLAPQICTLLRDANITEQVRIQDLDDDATTHYCGRSYK